MRAYWPNPYFDVIRTQVKARVYFEARTDEVTIT